MTDLGVESSALLEAARGGDEPTNADRERVRVAIATRLALAAGAGVGAAAIARSSAVALPAGVATKALVTVGLICAVGGAAVKLARTAPRAVAPRMGTAPAPIEAPAYVPEAVNVPTSLPSAALASSGAPAEVHPSARTFAMPLAVPGATSAARGARGDVAAEVRLLDEAQAATHGGHAERALGLLEQHGRRFPNGALGEEREAARIVALCALGRTAEARDATDRFLRAAPQSPQAGPLRASCGGSAAPTASPYGSR